MWVWPQSKQGFYIPIALAFMQKKRSAPSPPSRLKKDKKKAPPNHKGLRGLTFLNQDRSAVL